MSPRSDNWGVGQRADGSINIFDESELSARKAQRDAEERAFDEMLERSEAAHKVKDQAAE